MATEDENPPPAKIKSTGPTDDYSKGMVAAKVRMGHVVVHALCRHLFLPAYTKHRVCAVGVEDACSFVEDTYHTPRERERERERERRRRGGGGRERVCATCCMPLRCTPFLDPSSTVAASTGPVRFLISCSNCPASCVLLQPVLPARVQKAKKGPVTQASKKLAKVDKKGMKSMMSFFGAKKKKPKK